MTNRPLYIAIPAWRPDYVRLAVDYTIPAVLASLSERKSASEVTFLIHTDDRPAFQRALDGHKIEFFNLSFSKGRDSHWFAFKQAHKDAIAFAPDGSILTLLNSDIVVSRETFAVVDKVLLDGGIKVMASVGIRALIDGNSPPIGVDAMTLNRWIWSHRHHLTEECIWDHGRSRHPTVLYFENGEDVSMHGFHLTPMFLIKDRSLSFNGTIDDDVLQQYRDEEIYFVRDAEMSFAELSPQWKTHPFLDRLTVQVVLDFGKRRFSKAHVRNFKQRITVLGNPQKNDPAADAIIAGLPR